MQGLGELETVVMDVLWRGTGPLRVRDVRDVPARTASSPTRL